MIPQQNDPPRMFFPIKHRLNYIDGRLNGKNIEEMLEQAFDERAERLNEQVKDVAIALLEKQNIAEQSIQDLLEEAEELQILKPVQEQLERLRQTIQELQHKQAALTKNTAQARYSFDQKTKARDDLKTRIDLLNRLIREDEEKSHKINAFFCQAGKNVAIHVHKELNKPEITKSVRKD